ncbi:MAG: hypothetical protein QOF55_171 [Thermoleophilaceae bacterium]|nr:hypothetical protein [Thermoleophilaceae bacterium]
MSFNPAMVRLAAAIAATGAIAVATGAGSVGAGAQAPIGASTCPTVPDPAKLPSAAQLKQMNSYVAKLGVRPTGSTAHAKYIAWIRKQLGTIPGIQTSDLSFGINRWSASRARLELRSGKRTTRLAVADAIPNAKPTGKRGVRAPLAVVPAGTPIDTANASGKIVVRDAPAGSVQQALFLLPVVSWTTYDPNHTIDPSANFKGDFIAYLDRIADLKNAAAAGAKGILFVKPLPRRQIVGHYEPYEGLPWGVPGMFVGADQGKRITDAIAAGHHPSARIVLRAKFKRMKTPSVLATLPGASPQRLVIDSHTDGTNAAEDNGPVAMVAMARYFAALPAACRPRTLEFAFSTAHFYQRVAGPDTRDGGAEQLAQQLDRDYDKGTVSSVVVLEHLGAIDYEEVARPNGLPGVRLAPNGLRAIQFIGVTPSPPLVDAVNGVVQRYDMQRTILLQGSDAPGNTVPQHCSFGGEGTPYEKHLLPTVGVIAAPQSLYDPAFGLEGIDFGVMHSEVLGFTELIGQMAAMSQTEVSGQVDVERAQRANGAAGCPSGA